MGTGRQLDARFTETPVVRTLQNRLVVYGLKQAGLVGALLVPLFLVGIFSVEGGLRVGCVLPLLMTYLLLGPVFGLLNWLPLDLSGPQFSALCCGLAFPYWISLGLAAGYIGSKCISEVQEAAAEAQGRRAARWTIVVLLCVSTSLSLPLWPALASSGPSPIGRIQNRLKQLEAAKTLLAEEKGLKPGHAVTTADLAPYLGSQLEGFLRQVAAERYILNPIGEHAYAVFEANWRYRREGYTIPKGTVIRQTGNMERPPR